MTHAICRVILGGAVMVSCSLGELASSRIEVAQSNDLGIVVLEAVRSADASGNDVLVLRGLSQDGLERASARVTRGSIAELASNDGDLGTELVVAVDGTDARIYARASELDVQAGALDPAAAQFVGLDVVTAELERDLVTVVTAPTPNPEAQYSTETCPANYLLTSPIATQCCFQWFSPPGSDGTWFVRTSDSTAIFRKHNPSGAGCKASDGAGSCSGNQCFFGPNGFSTPYLYAGYTKIKNASGQYCYGLAGSPPYDFPNVTGTQPRGQGCPGGNSTPGFYDY